MSAFGLDIGTSSIKVVQLAKGANSFSLLAAGITSTPRPGLTSELENDLVGVSEAVKKLLADTKITSKEVNLSLPESQVFTRMISLPPLSDAEVASAISWQAEPYIPIPISEATVDYQIVARRQSSGPGDPGGVDVLLVAAPKNLVEKYIKVVSFAGLTVSLVETELLALSRSTAPPAATSLVVDLGATSTDIALVKDGQLLATRSIPTAGDTLSRSVSTGLSLDVAKAEEYKKAYGLDPRKLEGKVRAALEPAFRLILDEMKKTIQYYKSELKGQDEVVSAVVSGGVAGMPEVVSYLAEGLGIEATLANPFGKIAGAEKVSKSLAAYSPLYGVAVGLAMNI